MPALEALRKIDAIDRWDAVEGHYNLVIKLAPEAAEGVNRARTLDGLSDMKVCEIVAENNGSATVDPELCRAYVFIDVDAAHRDAIKAALSGVEEIASLIQTSGGCDMIALVTADNFDRINRVVNERIRPLDGLLRLKQDRIIDLDNL